MISEALVRGGSLGHSSIGGPEIDGGVCWADIHVRSISVHGHLTFQSLKPLRTEIMACGEESNPERFDFRALLLVTSLRRGREVTDAQESEHVASYLQELSVF